MMQIISQDQKGEVMSVFQELIVFTKRSRSDIQNKRVKCLDHFRHLREEGEHLHRVFYSFYQLIILMP